MTPADTELAAGRKAIAVLYNALMTGLVLTLVSRRGEQAAADFVFAHFRRQHLEKFLPGLEKLGLAGLPDAVACASYHFHSNALGGVKTQLLIESDRKAWVRYPPPRWIWQGAAVCAVPPRVNEAMLHGWHGHNGVSLGNPRLGFVCTGQTVLGHPGLEGYYVEYDQEVAEDQRVRFACDEACPPIDPAAQPVLDLAAWPPERLARVEVSYAAEYVRSLLPVMHALFGPAQAEALVGQTARLIGLQFHEATAAALGIHDEGADSFAGLLAALARAQGETVEVDGPRVVQTGWRLMRGVPLDPALAFAAWNPLWEGLLAAHNRHLRLSSELSGDRLVWTVGPNENGG